MKGDIAFAGFMLTADEWQELDAQSRAQLIAVATRRADPWLERPRRTAEGTGPHEIVEVLDADVLDADLLDVDLLEDEEELFADAPGADREPRAAPVQLSDDEAFAAAFDFSEEPASDASSAAVDDGWTMPTADVDPFAGYEMPAPEPFQLVLRAELALADLFAA